MSKTMKILSIILIVFSIILNIYSVYASDINMNLASNENVTNDTADENAIDDTNITEDESNVPQTSSDSSSLTPATGVNSIEEEGFSLSNILSILLITVGVILILLSIAIIIRLKS